MSQADQPTEWYLARDGQQHGPISAAEMDLSDLNIPSGTQVSQIRILTEFANHNPIGVGAVQTVVPAASAWGLFIFTLLVLAAGSIVVVHDSRRRQPRFSGGASPFCGSPPTA